jgi:hypothetical protein
MHMCKHTYHELPWRRQVGGRRLGGRQQSDSFVKPPLIVSSYLVELSTYTLKLLRRLIKQQIWWRLSTYESLD